MLSANESEAPIETDADDIKVEVNNSSKLNDDMETEGQSTIKLQKLETHEDTNGEVNIAATATEDVKCELNSVGTQDSISTALAPVNRPTAEPKTRNSLKWNLRVIISNLYMKTELRLPGARVPKCLHNTSQCVSIHRCAMLPNAPEISRAQDLRNNLHNQHYDTFLDMLEMMALQCVYPDESGFERLFDMMMIITAKSLTMQELRTIYMNVIRTFYLLLDTFPPCWTALRPYYLHFLGVNNASEAKSQKLQLLLDLLEDAMAKCTETELRELTNFYEDCAYNHVEEENGGMTQEDVFLRHVQDYDWLGDKQWIDDFKKMSPGVRLARVCDALNIICWVLESEFMSWLDHNRMQQAEPELFQDETKPFVLIVFGMTAEKRLTDITRQLLRLYSRAAAKSMQADRLKILQRFVSLIMEASNTAELEYVDNALIYPNLGPQTRRLIAEFFKIFKTENPTHISTYIKTIQQLDQPYVRFEFANLFLQIFYSSSAPFRPEKVCEEFKSKQWLKYKQRSSIEEDDDEQLSREDYLQIMLNALKDYCTWLNLQPCWKYIKTKVPVQPLQTRTTSPLATPVGVVTGDVGKIFMFDEMQKEAHTWSQRINLKVIVTKPKVNLPVARINASKMAELYGGNIRQLRYLRRVLLEVMRYVNVTDWLDYLDDFLGEDVPQSTADHGIADHL